MLWITLALTGLGVLLLLGGPGIARLLASARWSGIHDPGGLARLLQMAGAGLLVAALLLLPQDTGASASPAPERHAQEQTLPR